MEQNQHGQPEEETRDHGGDVALSTILMVGIAGSAILVVIIILVRGLFVSAIQQENYAKVIQQKPVELMQLRDQALNRINVYDWLNREQGIVSIPIDQAMALAVKKLKAEQSKPHPQPALPTVTDTSIEPGQELPVTPAEDLPAISTPSIP